MSEQLKACPFCGGEVEITGIDSNINDNGTWHIECTECLASMQESYLLGVYSKGDKAPTRKAVINRWNARAKDFDTLAQRLQEAERLLEDARLMTFVVNSGQSGVLRGQIDAFLAPTQEKGE